MCVIASLDVKASRTPTLDLLEKFNNKRSELKYLSNFRKRNQTRFYE
jgi:hypothetical protein